MPMSSTNPRAANKSTRPSAIRRFFMVISRNSDPCYEPSLRVCLPIETGKIGRTLRWGQRVIPQSVIGKNDGESAIRSPPAPLTGAL